MSDSNPDAGHDVRKKDHGHFQLDEVNVLANFLASVPKPWHQNLLAEQVDLVKESIIVYEPCELSNVDTRRFLSNKAWKSCDTVENKGCFEVFDSNLFKVTFFLVVG